MDCGKLYTMTSLTTIRRNRRILVGVTGGIAAYKSPDLVRRLLERGGDVRVVVTAGACEFITPLTLQAVSGHPVYANLLDTEAESGMGHIELARWAETIVVAPATANFLAGLAHGRADDLLSTLAVASNAELIVAPSMNQQMWQNPATQQNIKTLKERGVQIIGPGKGDQACGEVGPGRMTEPDQIAQQILGDGIPQLFKDKHFVLTAGPTWEAIDPVRGITNHSSGKMGFSMAQAALDFGARVTIVSGPVHLETPTGANRINVLSATQMLDAVMEQIEQADVFIGVAAVADYRPAEMASQKIKKKDGEEGDEMMIRLVRNPDILASVSAHAHCLDKNLVTIGFAAETQNLADNAGKKLKAKNVDMIVANNVAGRDGAFGNDENRVTMFYQDESCEVDSADKYAVCVKILEKMHQQFLR
jgi:phosphopantothenoylcysteine decarboxylase/phosphopantothenate--cysteine ligase